MKRLGPAMDGMLPAAGARMIAPSQLQTKKSDSSPRAVCRFRPPPQGRLVIWELTNHCNLACLHCCTNSSPQVSRVDDATSEAIVRALSEVEAANVSEVFFTGGEPFVRKDLPEIVEAACSQKIAVFMATNGTLLTETNVSNIRRAGIRGITISLDGHNAELHNRLRRHPTAFDRAVRGIRLCVDAGMPIRVAHVITPDNRRHVEDMCRFVAELGVPWLILNSTVAVGRADEEEQKQIVLSEADRESALNAVVGMQASFAGRMRIDHSLHETRSAAPVGCPAGARLVHIAGNGDVSTCSWLYKLDPRRFTLGNIKTESLAAILNRARSCMEQVAQIDTECPIPRIEHRRNLLRVAT